MNSLDAVERVLVNAGKPMRSKVIAQQILELGLWETKGLTPDRTIDARIAVDIREHGITSRFQRTSKGVYALRAWALPEYVAKLFQKNTQRPYADETAEMISVELPDANLPEAAPAPALSFNDAAERVLEQFSNKKPMHYEVITDKALELKLIKTEGQTPGQTMYAQILTEIKRKTQRGETARFEKYGKGLVGLSRWVEPGLAHQIEQHNKEVRKKLHQRLYNMAPSEFEDLIGALLVKIGFEDVEVTGRSGDGGIDVRGTLVVGSVIRTRMAVQAKRWKTIYRPLLFSR